MKKTLVSALTTALVVGAASTTFAAANPFADVPADHWAYDAVSQLAADGIIDGYGDGSYKGDRNITRYEMAQMVAKAMAKNPSGADKALVDKLAAEFADELNNLGVRVANLERNADMVKWTGKAEYTFDRTTIEDSANDSSDNKVLFRLEPTAEVNSNWQVKARLDANINLDSDDTSDNVKLKRIWAQGNYDNFTVKAGKFAAGIADDIILDHTLSGVQVKFGNQLQATVEGGRLANWSSADSEFSAAAKALVNSGMYVRKDISNYYGIGLNYTLGKLGARAGYQNFSGDADDTRIWNVGANYAFSKNVALDGIYAQSNSDDYNRAYAVELDYKGAEAANKGTWGAWAAYRYLGQNVALSPTYDAIAAGQKGFEVGFNYAPWKNIVTTVRYGNGKVLSTDKSYNTLFGRVEFFF